MVFRRFRQDERGAAALEFALIAPVLITIYLSVAEFSEAMIAQTKAGHVASAVGDLVARSRTVSASDLDDYFAIGSEIMTPFPGSSLGIRVSSLTKTGNGAPTVTWSRGYGSLAATGAGTAVTIPLALDTGETVIMAESSYQYASVVHYLLPQAMTFNQSFYLRPRVTDAITCKDC